MCTCYRKYNFKPKRIKLDDDAIDRELEAAALQTITALLEHQPAAAAAAATTTAALASASTSHSIPSNPQLPQHLLAGQQSLEPRIAASITAEITVALAQAEAAARAYAAEDEDDGEEGEEEEEEEEADDEEEEDLDIVDVEADSGQAGPPGSQGRGVKANGHAGAYANERFGAVFGLEVLGEEGDESVDGLAIPLRARKGTAGVMPVLAGLKRKR